MTSFTDHLRANGRDLIPRKDWRPINRSGTLGKDFVLDQRECSGCVGYSAAQALMRERALRGMGFHRLSGASIYCRINGNRDQGAIITDALQALCQYGASLESEFDYPHYLLRDMPESAKRTAKRFRLRLGLTLSNFDEMGTALQMGFIVQYPIQVGNNYERFSRDGVCGFDVGQGNHSVHADGMQFVNGLWVFDSPGTWGDDWGPFGNGRAFHSERAIMGCETNEDAYTHVIAEEDPEEEGGGGEGA
jgi:hypothetical protein